MSAVTEAKPETADAQAAAPSQRPRRTSRAAATLLAEGETMSWLMGGSLAICVLMIVGLVALILYFGTSTFWPLPIVKVTTYDGSVYMGEITRDETYFPTEAQLKNLPPETQQRVRTLLQEEEIGPPGWHRYLWLAEALLAGLLLAVWAKVATRSPLRVAAAAGSVVALGLAVWGTVHIASRTEESGLAERYLFRTENFDITQTHFHWVSQLDVKRDGWTQPDWALSVERVENGRFYGFPTAFAYVRYPVEPQTAEGMPRPAQEQLAEAERILAQMKTRYGGLKRLLVLKPYERRIDTERTETSDRPVAVTADATEGVSRVIGVAEVIEGPEIAWQHFEKNHEAAHDRFREVQYITKHDLGDVEWRDKQSRLAVMQIQLEYGEQSPEHRRAQEEYERLCAGLDVERSKIMSKIESLRAENERLQLLVRTADGTPHMIPAWEIVRGYPANRLSWAEKAGVYLSRWTEFLTDNPRKANSEGGVLPPLVGTIAMTLIMALAVVPFGVLAALYLREYAKAGPVTSAVRIAINNLAGVPSIVFGVFGYGFFCLGVGAYIDGGPKNIDVEPWMRTTWLAVMGALAAVATAAFLSGLFALAGKQGEHSRRKRILRTASFVLWLMATALLVALVVKMPGFNGFYRAEVELENNPIFGKGALIWASFTLALLTLPVVIVSTEEALAAVPNSMREGSYACGASKWQTIQRIVLPRAMPGVMTGMILAMARGAGEVAPLMLVGVVKIARDLPVDVYAPFLHLERGFMHLGFHVYDLGFQSQNSEAAKSIVYTTTLLLITVIAVLNLFAVWLRGRLRRKFMTAQF